jgi:hypothetical protein
VGEHIGVAAIILGARKREPVAETIHLLGVDRTDLAAPLQEGFDYRPVRDLYPDPNFLQVATGEPLQALNQLGQAVSRMGERLLQYDLSLWT